jgi:hypothetical protein
MKIKNKHLLTASALYFVLWIIFSNFLIHSINPDTISYISISKKYYDGNFSEAINACWGPLLSWLILPAFLIKIEPHIFARIIFGIFSVILFILIDKFCTKLKLNDNLKKLGLYFFILPAIFFSFYRLTPDYLLLILTLVYVYLALDQNFWRNKRIVIISSVLGALMFLTKSYGMAFFLTFQTIILLINYLSYRKIDKTILINYFLSLLLFFILITPWIYLLSNKYGNLTISTAGAINIRIVNPELNFRHPPIESGFAFPSDKYSVSAWDDPDINAYPKWNPLSTDNIQYFAKNTVKNVLKLFVFILAFAPIITFSIFFLKKKDFQNPVLLTILIAGLIYGLGYTPIYVENRYIWPSFVLFSLVGLLSLNSFFSRLNKTQLTIAGIIIILSFVPFFIYGITQQLSTTSAYYQANSIKNKFGIKGNFASTNYWSDGLAISYFLNSKFYGTEKLPINSPELSKKAKKMGIDYIFDYSGLSDITTDLEFVGKIDSIKIYKVLSAVQNKLKPDQ